MKQPQAPRTLAGLVGVILLFNIASDVAQYFLTSRLTPAPQCVPSTLEDMYHVRQVAADFDDDSEGDLLARRKDVSCQSHWIPQCRTQGAK